MMMYKVVRNEELSNFCAFGAEYFPTLAEAFRNAGVSYYGNRHTIFEARLSDDGLIEAVSRILFLEDEYEDDYEEED